MHNSQLNWHNFRLSIQTDLVADCLQWTTTIRMYQKSKSPMRHHHLYQRRQQVSSLLLSHSWSQSRLRLCRRGRWSFCICKHPMSMHQLMARSSQLVDKCLLIVVWKSSWLDYQLDPNNHLFRWVTYQYWNPAGRFHLCCPLCHLCLYRTLKKGLSKKNWFGCMSVEWEL